jgi:hypothetical protein
VIRQRKFNRSTLLSRVINPETAQNPELHQFTRITRELVGRHKQLVTLPEQTVIRRKWAIFAIV